MKPRLPILLPAAAATNPAAPPAAAGSPTTVRYDGRVVDRGGHPLSTTTGSVVWMIRSARFSVPGCGGPPVPASTLGCASAGLSLRRG